MANRDASKDPAFRGLRNADVDPLLRNVYKMLLTRGMVGTILHSTDQETQTMLGSLFGVRGQDPAVS